MVLKAYDKVVKRKHKEWESTYTKDPFLLDYDKITQSRAYRRLTSKTQVICDPNQPHVRTRNIHSNDVVRVSTEIASALGLNINLCRAIAIGHDLGHTPYGHIGEHVFSEFAKKDFRHYVNSVVVAQKIEKQGNGLNLTFPVLKGMLLHSRGKGDMVLSADEPQEYNVVMFADKIAYTFTDLNDALRYGMLSKEDMPKEATDLGSYENERMMAVVDAVISESKEKGYVSFSEGEVFEKFKSLRNWMYENIYFKVNHNLQKVILKEILSFFSADEFFKGIDPVLLASLLTDAEANYFADLLKRSIRPNVSQIKHFSIFEIIPHIRGNKINWEDPDLNEEDFVN